MEHRTPLPRRRPMIDTPRPAGRLAALFLAVVLVGGCAADIVTPSPSSPAISGLPVPTCGGLKIAIDPSLPCERVVEIAIAALRARAPQQLARGVAAIDVLLSDCPSGEVPPQITCGGSTFAQMVTVTFGPAGNSGFIEPSLTVAVEPTTGAVLGISNPLIR
jgi:hypothetical protein